MKKFTIGTIFCAISIFLTVFTSCNPSVTETVYSYKNPEITEISVFAEPGKVNYAKGDKLDLKGLVIKAKYDNDVTGIITEGYTASPAADSVLSTVGKNTVKITYKTFETSFNVTVYEEDPDKPAEITGITLKKSGVKTSYIKGEKLDLSELIVLADYDNGESKTVTNYTAEPADGSELNEAGTQVVTITYEGQTAAFDVTVYEEDPDKPAEITGITLKKSGVKTSYIKGEKLDLSELIVLADYDDGESKTVTNYTAEPADETVLNETGAQVVTITYEGQTAAFDVTVYEKLPEEITGISILNGVKKTVYQTGETLNLEGLIIGATDGNGDTKVITNYTTEPAAGSTLEKSGKIQVAVNYLNFTERFEITVSEQVISEEVYLESISILQKPFVTSYETGDSFDAKGLIISGTYSDGIVALISEGDYAIDLTDGTELNEEGVKTVTVTKGTLSTAFTITVVKKVIYGESNSILVSVSSESDIEVEKSEVTGGVSFTAASGYETYIWKVNSVTYSTESTFDFTTSELVPGVYTVLLIAKDSDGNYRSSTNYVQVTNRVSE